MKIRFRLLHAFIAVLLLLGSTVYAQLPPAQQAAPRSIDEALATISVGDLQGFLDRVEKIRAMLQPEASGAGALRTQIGAFFGDPTLAGIPAGNGAMVIMFPGMVSAGFIEVAPDHMQAYAQAAAAMGMMAEPVGDLLAISNTDQGIATARAAAPRVAPMLAAPAAPEASLNLFPARAIALYEAMIQGLLQSMPMMIASMQAQSQGDYSNMQSQARILEAQMRGLYAGLKQVDSLQYMLKLPDAGIEINTVLKPAAGSDLAALAALKVGDATPLLDLLPSQGAIRGAISTNYEANSAFFGKLALDVMQQMRFTQEEQDGLKSYIDTMAAANGDKMAMDLLVPGQGFLSGSFVIQVKDTDAAIAALESMEQLLQDSGISAFYESIGAALSVGFQKNAREYNGVAVHKIPYSQSMSNLPTGPMEIQAIFELATAKDMLLYAVGTDPSVDSLIDAATAGSNPQATRLGAMKDFAPGGFMYFDVSPSKLVSAIKSIMGASIPPEQAVIFDFVAGSLAGVRPVTGAGYLRGGNLETSVLFPSDLIQALANLKALQAQMEAQQQLAPAAQ